MNCIGNVFTSNLAFIALCFAFTLGGFACVLSILPAQPFY